MRGDHLKLRRGRWSFRLRVPADLNDQLGTEITRDLGTANRREAERLARQYATDVRGAFATLRAGVYLDDPRSLVRRMAEKRLTRLGPVEGEGACEGVGDLAADPLTTGPLLPTACTPASLPPPTRPGKTLARSVALPAPRRRRPASMRGC